MEKETEVKIKHVQVKLICDVCFGNMEQTGIVLYSSPLQYEHKCVECDHKENTLKTYPYIKPVIVQ